jgi:hypothetical protein
MPTLEGDVLKPVDARIDSNDWEIFVLSNAHVVDETNGKPVSLLTAYADIQLLYVIGEESLDEAQ